jgi:hypothetical protein
MIPPWGMRHIRFKHTRGLKEAAQRQLSKFRDEILEKNRADPYFWNSRVKNLMDDIDELNRDVDALTASDIWPPQFSERFKDIYKTTRRLGLNLVDIDKNLV